MASDDSWQQWFEKIWEFREETLYRQWFTTVDPSIACLTPALFKSLGVADIDPRWLHHGILTCPPTSSRSHWAYISSGLSNPWGQNPADPASTDPKQFSGLGLELLLLTPVKADWPITTLSWLTAVILLVASGKLRGSLPEIGDRIPLGNSVEPGSAIRHILLTEPPDDLAAHFRLDSGVVDLMLCVGCTDAEVAFGREKGSGELLEKLKGGGGYPVTRPGRGSVL